MTTGPGSPRPRHRARRTPKDRLTTTARAASAVVLTAAVVGLAVVFFSAFSLMGSHLRQGRGSAPGCVAAALPGRVVDVRLADMPSMMTGQSMMGGRRGLLSQQDWPRFTHGMMSLTATPASVPAGTVSLRVSNAGYLTHELVVLPLVEGQTAGQRIVGPDGTVAETGILGEASTSCGAGPGNGIITGSIGWVSLTLPAGHYELLCNLPGHYLAGMRTELTLT